MYSCKAVDRTQTRPLQPTQLYALDSRTRRYDVAVSLTLSAVLRDSRGNANGGEIHRALAFRNLQSRATLVAPPTVRPSSVLAYLYPRASTDDPGAPVRLPVLYRLQLYTVHLHAGLLACYSAAIGSLSVILNTERITRVLLHTAVDRPMAMSGM